MRLRQAGQRRVAAEEALRCRAAVRQPGIRSSAAHARLVRAQRAPPVTNCMGDASASAAWAARRPRQPRSASSSSARSASETLERSPVTESLPSCTGGGTAGRSGAAARRSAGQPRLHRRARMRGRESRRGRRACGAHRRNDAVAVQRALQEAQRRGLQRLRGHHVAVQRLLRGGGGQGPVQSRRRWGDMQRWLALRASASRARGQRTCALSRLASYSSTCAEARRQLARATRQLGRRAGGRAAGWSRQARPQGLPRLRQRARGQPQAPAPSSPSRRPLLVTQPREQGPSRAVRPAWRLLDLSVSRRGSAERAAMGAWQLGACLLARRRDRCDAEFCARRAPQRRGGRGLQAGVSVGAVIGTPVRKCCGGRLACALEACSSGNGLWAVASCLASSGQLGCSGQARLPARLPSISRAGEGPWAGGAAQPDPAAPPAASPASRAAFAPPFLNRPRSLRARPNGGQHRPNHRADPARMPLSPH
jgi:hypothetical protein